MTAAFKWFVVVSGVYDLLLGAALIASSPPGETWILNLTLGAFLLFAGAVLIWAAGSMQDRAPLILWQGLVRGVAAAGSFFALSQGFVPSENVPMVQLTALIDAVCIVVYVLGLTIVLRLSLLRLLFGRSDQR